MAEINGILNNPKYMDEALDIAKRFAYRTTALIGTLKWARERGGVLAPGQFLWLRGEDRALWYPLNNLWAAFLSCRGCGRDGALYGGKSCARPLPIPRLETAILTVIQYWSDTARHAQTGGAPIMPALKEVGKK